MSVKKSQKGNILFPPNQKISEIFLHTAELLDINGVKYKPAAYRKAAGIVKDFSEDVVDVYKKKGLKGLKEISGIGESMAAKIEEYSKKKKIKFYEELKEKTALREIITHFFESKGVSLSQLKANARKQKIVYARHTVPAKQLLELAESVPNAKKAIDKVAAWANTRSLDYSIETISKKWLELDRLKPKKIEKKAFYQGNPMVWVEAKKKWFVVLGDGDWREFADKEEKIEWRTVK